MENFNSIRLTAPLLALSNCSVHYFLSNLILKKIIKDNNQPNRRENGEGSLILEADEETHEIILKKGKLNIGWAKYLRLIILMLKDASNAGDTIILQKIAREM